MRFGEHIPFSLSVSGGRRLLPGPSHATPERCLYVLTAGARARPGLVSTRGATVLRPAIPSRPEHDTPDGGGDHRLPLRLGCVGGQAEES